MIVIQEYYLPEDQEEYERMLDSTTNYYAVEDVREYVRRTLKHSELKHIETMDVLQCILNLLPPRR